MWAILTLRMFKTWFRHNIDFLPVNLCGNIFLDMVFTTAWIAINVLWAGLKPHCRAFSQSPVRYKYDFDNLRSMCHVQLKRYVSWVKCGSFFFVLYHPMFWSRRCQLEVSWSFRAAWMRERPPREKKKANSEGTTAVAMEEAMNRI